MIGCAPCVSPWIGSIDICITDDRIVIAPTATSPPYLSRLVLKQMFNTLSVNCMINGATPSAIHGPTVFGRIFRFPFRILSVVSFPSKNRTIHTQETPCERIVASAAPRTPICNPKIKIGSNIILHTAPITTVSIPVLANPCALMNAFSPNASCTKMVPSE